MISLTVSYVFKLLRIIQWNATQISIYINFLHLRLVYTLIHCNNELKNEHYILELLDSINSCLIKRDTHCSSSQLYFTMVSIFLNFLDTNKMHSMSTIVSSNISTLVLTIN